MADNFACKRCGGIKTIIWTGLLVLVVCVVLIPDEVRGSHLSQGGRGQSVPRQRSSQGGGTRRTISNTASRTNLRSSMSSRRVPTVNRLSTIRRNLNTITNRARSRINSPSPSRSLPTGRLSARSRSQQTGRLSARSGDQQTGRLSASSGSQQTGRPSSRSGIQQTGRLSARRVSERISSRGRVQPGSISAGRIRPLTNEKADNTLNSRRNPQVLTSSINSFIQSLRSRIPNIGLGFGARFESGSSAGTGSSSNGFIDDRTRDDGNRNSPANSFANLLSPISSFLSASRRSRTRTRTVPPPTQPLPTQPFPTLPPPQSNSRRRQSSRRQRLQPTNPLPTQPLPPTRPLPTQPLPPTRALPTQPLPPTRPLPTQPLPTQPLPATNPSRAVNFQPNFQQQVPMSGNFARGNQNMIQANMGQMFMQVPNQIASQNFAVGQSSMLQPMTGVFQPTNGLVRPLPVPPVQMQQFVPQQTFMQSGMVQPNALQNLLPVPIASPPLMQGVIAPMNNNQVQTGQQQTQLQNQALFQQGLVNQQALQVQMQPLNTNFGQTQQFMQPNFNTNPLQQGPIIPQQLPLQPPLTNQIVAQPVGNTFNLAGGIQGQTINTQSIQNQQIPMQQNLAIQGTEVIDTHPGVVQSNAGQVFNAAQTVFQSQLLVPNGGVQTPFDSAKLMLQPQLNVMGQQNLANTTPLPLVSNQIAKPTTAQNNIIQVDPNSKGVKLVPDGKGGIQVINIGNNGNSKNAHDGGLGGANNPPSSAVTFSPIYSATMLGMDRKNTTDIPEELEINGTSYDSPHDMNGKVHPLSGGLMAKPPAANNFGGEPVPTPSKPEEGGGKDQNVITINEEGEIGAKGGINFNIHFSPTRPPPTFASGPSNNLNYPDYGNNYYYDYNPGADLTNSNTDYAAASPVVSNSESEKIKELAKKLKEGTQLEAPSLKSLSQSQLNLAADITDKNVKLNDLFQSLSNPKITGAVDFMLTTETSVGFGNSPFFASDAQTNDVLTKDAAQPGGVDSFGLGYANPEVSFRIDGGKVKFDAQNNFGPGPSSGITSLLVDKTPAALMKLTGSSRLGSNNVKEMANTLQKTLGGIGRNLISPTVSSKMIENINTAVKSQVMTAVEKTVKLQMLNSIDSILTSKIDSLLNNKQKKQVKIEPPPAMVQYNPTTAATTTTSTTTKSFFPPFRKEVKPPLPVYNFLDLHSNKLHNEKPVVTVPPRNIFFKTINRLKNLKTLRLLNRTKPNFSEIRNIDFRFRPPMT